MTCQHTETESSLRSQPLAGKQTILTVARCGIFWLAEVQNSGFMSTKTAEKAKKASDLLIIYRRA